MQKKMYSLVFGVLVFSGLAAADSLVINFDSALITANLNPNTTDGNLNANGDENGILDSDELAELSMILGNAAHPNHVAVHTAYTTNLARMNVDMSSNATLNGLKAGYMVPLAAYITLGDGGGFVRAQAILYLYSANTVLIDTANYDQTQSTVLAYNSDPDGDGLTNVQEYQAIAGTGGVANPPADLTPTAKRIQYLHDLFTPAAVLDTTPPTGTIVINGNRSATNSRTVMIAMTWSDGTGSGVARMRFSDDGSTWSAYESLAPSRSHTLPVGADGHRTVRVQFIDKANNRSATYSDYILLDRTPPTGSIIINNGDAVTNNPTVTLGLTWSDGTGVGVTRMRFSDNGSTWSAWETPGAMPSHTLLAGLGYRTVRVQYMDGAGNYSGVYNDYIKLTASLSLTP